MMDLRKINSVHFIGIGGIGVSALARLFLGLGKKVSGSDIKESQITSDLTSLGANIFIGHQAYNIRKPDVVIYSEDITKESAGFIELEAASQQAIPLITYSQALGKLMERMYGIGVTGINGKSTTTALLGLMLDEAGMNPTVVVGTKISPLNETGEFKANARLGNSKLFVCEADEYHRHMLDAHPTMIILTNIAEDHLDYYKDLAEIKSAFVEYMQSLPPDGSVIFNADDHNTLDVVRLSHCHKFSFGIHHYADLQALNLEIKDDKQFFDMHYKDKFIGKFELSVLGKFNVLNALGASLAAIRLGVAPETISTVLKNFKGTWRRFELLGQLSNTTIVSDYGHHPAGIAETMLAVKEFYPGKKVLLVFQPHHRNRTKKLFGDFVEALRNAENLVIPEIFDVAGREHGEQVSSKDLVDELIKLSVKAEYAKDLEEAESLVRQKANNFDMIIFMGAGDIDALARKLAHD